MNKMGKLEKRDPSEIFQRQGGMTEREALYMKQGKEPAAGSVPMSTSKYLNSPLFSHAFKTMALRRYGEDLPFTWDIPEMTRGIADVTDYFEAATIVERERENNHEFDAWLAARKPLAIEATDVSECAPGTLGHAVHAFITQSGMTMRFVHNVEARSDYEFVMQAIGHSHDLQHLLTGFGPNHAGELALAVMNVTANARLLSSELAQELSINNSFVSSAMIARTMFNYHAGVPLMAEAVRMGIDRGEALNRPLFMIDYSAHLDQPLEDIATEYGFDRGPGDQWEEASKVLRG